MIRSVRRAAVGLATAAVALTLAAGPALASTDPNVPPLPPKDANGTEQGLADPGAKATAPQTDLTNHPKGAPHLAPPPGQKGDTSEVISSTPSADGKTVAVTVYDPAPGTTPAGLAASLRQSGTKNVRVVTPPSSGGATPQVVDPNECVYGYAQTIDFAACPPPVHWNNEGFSNPHIRYNDHTGSAWPVNTAVYDWNTANGVNSYYLYNSCPFQAGARCVDVNEVNVPPVGGNGYAGLTTYTFNASDHSFVDLGMTIALNDYYANLDHYPAGTYRETIEHEMGHSLGLGHSADTASAMYFQATLTNPPLMGDANDFTFLANLYSIAR